MRVGREPCLAVALARADSLSAAENGIQKEWTTDYTDDTDEEIASNE